MEQRRGSFENGSSGWREQVDRYRQGPGWDREAGLSILHVRESMDEELVQQAGTQWLWR